MILFTNELLPMNLLNKVERDSVLKNNAEVRGPRSEVQGVYLNVNVNLNLNLNLNLHMHAHTHTYTFTQVLFLYNTSIVYLGPQTVDLGPRTSDLGPRTTLSAIQFQVVSLTL